MDEGTTWWESFLKRKDRVYNDKKSLETLRNIQNFYESFCTSKNVAGEPTFEEDLIHKEGVPKEDTDNEDFEMQDDCFPNAENGSSDGSEDSDSCNPFVRQLAALKNKPNKLEAKVWPETVSILNAIQALNEIENEKPRGTFTLLQISVFFHQLNEKYINFQMTTGRLWQQMSWFRKRLSLVWNY